MKWKGVRKRVIRKESVSSYYQCLFQGYSKLNKDEGRDDALSCSNGIFRIRLCFPSNARVSTNVGIAIQV